MTHARPWLVPALAALVACSARPNRPEPLDNPGIQIPPGGGGGTNDAGFDAGSSDGAAPAPAVLASGLLGPGGIALSAVYAYVTVDAAPSDAGSGGAVLEIPRLGGTPRVVVDGIEAPKAVAVSGTTLCYTTAPQQKTGQVACMTVGLPPATSLAVGRTSLESLAIGGSYVYWASAASGVSVERSETTTAAVTELTTILSNCEPRGVALYAGYVYVACSGQGANVFATPLAGGSALALDQPTLATYVDVVPDGARMLVGRGADNGNTGAIVAVSASGAGTTALADKIASPGHLARDATHVYWTSPSEGAVYALSLSATKPAPVVIATGLDTPSGIAVDDAVYVVTRSTLVRMPLAP